MTYDEISERLVSLAQANGGVLTADQVERDPELASEDRDVVSAAARALDGTHQRLRVASQLRGRMVSL
jgi:hypothetical protein